MGLNGPDPASPGTSPHPLTIGPGTSFKVRPGSDLSYAVGVSVSSPSFWPYLLDDPQTYVVALSPDPSPAAPKYPMETLILQTKSLQLHSSLSSDDPETVEGQ